MTASITPSPEMGLLPCPFCGETHIYLNQPSDRWPKGSINCPACMVVMPGEIGGPRREEELIEQWNTRAKPALSCPDGSGWMNSLVGNLARDERGRVIGVEWLILTNTGNIDNLPQSLAEAARAMLAASPVSLQAKDSK